VLEAILNDFPEIPLQAVNCSLYMNDTFIVRCSERRWRDALIDRAVVLDNGTPLQIQPWSRLFMTEQIIPRYMVGIFVEGLPSAAFTVQTARKVLPSCLFHTVAVSSMDKMDLSYFIVYAWVHDPDTIHKVVVIDLPVIQAAAAEPLDGLVLPPGFGDNPMATPSFTLPPMTRFYAMVHIDSLVHVPLSPGMSTPGGGDGGDGHPMMRGGRWVDGTVAGPPVAPWVSVIPTSIFDRLGSRPSRPSRPSRRRHDIALSFRLVGVVQAPPEETLPPAGLGANPRPCIRRNRSLPPMLSRAELAPSGLLVPSAMQPVVQPTPAAMAHEGLQPSLSTAMFITPSHVPSDVQTHAILEEVTGTLQPQDAMGDKAAPQLGLVTSSPCADRSLDPALSGEADAASENEGAADGLAH
jgi:hypothetical protein